MKLGRIKDLQLALGTNAAGQPTMSYHYAKTVKYCAGYRAGVFDIDGAVRWLKRNGNHRVRDAWPATHCRKKSGNEVTQSPSRNRSNLREINVGKQSEPLSTHA